MRFPGLVADLGLVTGAGRYRTAINTVIAAVSMPRLDFAAIRPHLCCNVGVGSVWS